MPPPAPPHCGQRPVNPRLRNVEADVGPYKAARGAAHRPSTQPRSASPRPAVPGTRTMLGPLSYLLLVPLATCFPLLDRDRPVDAPGDIGGGMSWAGLAGGPRLLWGPLRWPRAPFPEALLAVAVELQAAGRERAGLRARAGRQEPGDHGGSEAAGVLPADREKSSGPLGSLAEELSSYSRKKGGFSFRFGRR